MTPKHTYLHFPLSISVKDLHFRLEIRLSASDVTFWNCQLKAAQLRREKYNWNAPVENFFLIPSTMIVSWSEIAGTRDWIFIWKYKHEIKIKTFKEGVATKVGDQKNLLRTDV